MRHFIRGPKTSEVETTSTKKNYELLHVRSFNDAVTTAQVTNH